MQYAFYNGDICDIHELKIPLTDRGVFFGDGVYEALIGRDGEIYLEDEHLDRFECSCRYMDLAPCVTRDELSRLMREVVRKNRLSEYFIYFQLTRYGGERVHAYTSNKTNLLITAKEFSLPEKNKKLKLITTDDNRYRMCNVKTLNLIPNVLASTLALSKGCDEAVFIRDGYVTECAHSNIAIIKNNTLITHPEGNLILPGITRKRMLTLAGELGILTVEKPFTKAELISADAAIVTSTTKLALAVLEIDEIPLIKAENEVANTLISAMLCDYLGSFEKNR